MRLEDIALINAEPLPDHAPFIERTTFSALIRTFLIDVPEAEDQIDTIENRTAQGHVIRTTINLHQAIQSVTSEGNHKLNILIRRTPFPTLYQRFNALFSSSPPTPPPCSAPTPKPAIDWLPTSTLSILPYTPLPSTPVLHDAPRRPGGQRSREQDHPNSSGGIKPQGKRRFSSSDPDDTDEGPTASSEKLKLTVPKAAKVKVETADPSPLIKRPDPKKYMSSPITKSRSALSEKRNRRPPRSISQAFVDSVAPQGAGQPDKGAFPLSTRIVMSRKQCRSLKEASLPPDDGDFDPSRSDSAFNKDEPSLKPFESTKVIASGRSQPAASSQKQSQVTSQIPHGQSATSLKAACRSLSTAQQSQAQVSSCTVFQNPPPGNDNTTSSVSSRVVIDLTDDHDSPLHLSPQAPSHPVKPAATVPKNKQNVRLSESLQGRQSRRCVGPR